MLTHIDLFSGIGGFTLSAEWAGFKTIALCEIDPYCQSILRHHFPGVPIVSDIKEFMYERIKYPYHHLDLLTASPPCQPVSVAGKRGGKSDDRWLWHETLRVLAELRPTWCCFENPAGIKGMDKSNSISEVESDEDETSGQTQAELFSWLDGITAEMERIGYRVQPVVIPACAVNAIHRRDRVWIVGYTQSILCERSYTEGNRCRRPEMQAGGSGADSLSHDTHSVGKGLQGMRVHQETGEQGLSRESARMDKPVSEKQGDIVADSDSQRGCVRNTTGQDATYAGERPHHKSDGQGDIESGLCSMDDGLPEGLAGCIPIWAGGEWQMPHPLSTGKTERKNRLSALGNAVCPQQSMPILRAIAEIEKQKGESNE